MAVIQGVVGEYLAKTFGGRFTVATTTPLATTAGIALLANDPERVFISVVNLGDFPVRVNHRDIPTLGGGWLLAPSGGMLSFNLRDDFIMPQLSWYALGVGGSSGVSVTNVRRFAPAGMAGDGDAV